MRSVMSYAQPFRDVAVGPAGLLAVGRAGAIEELCCATRTKGRSAGVPLQQARSDAAIS
jgi:hypothetical protein